MRASGLPGASAGSAATAVGAGAALAAVAAVAAVAAARSAALVGARRPLSGRRMPARAGASAPPVVGRPCHPERQPRRASAGAGAGLGRFGLGAPVRAALVGRLDDRDLGVVRDRRPFLDEDLLEDAGERRRDLGVDLVGDDLEERLVLRDRVAGLLQPLADRPLGDALAELGHRHLGHVLFLRVAGRTGAAASFCARHSVAHRATQRRQRAVRRPAVLPLSATDQVGLGRQMRVREAVAGARQARILGSRRRFPSNPPPSTHWIRIWQEEATADGARGGTDPAPDCRCSKGIRAIQECGVIRDAPARGATFGQDE